MLRRATSGDEGRETRAKVANTCEHPDLPTIYRHWRAKRGWHPARHPCHPLNLLEIYNPGAISTADSALLGGISGKNVGAVERSVTADCPARRQITNKTQ
jgi:hypothetical protein